MRGRRERSDDRLAIACRISDGVARSPERVGEVVDVVEVPGRDRRDERGGQLVERARVGRRAAGNGCAGRFVDRCELREAAARRAPLVRPHVRQEPDAGEQLERRMQHEGVGRRGLRAPR